MIYPNLQRAGISRSFIYKADTLFKLMYSTEGWEASLPLLIKARKRDSMLFELNKTFSKGLPEPVI